MNADLDAFATELYVAIDDILRANPHLVPPRPAIGIAPRLSDAELVTLAVLQAPFRRYGTRSRGAPRTSWAARKSCPFWRRAWPPPEGMALPGPSPWWAWRAWARPSSSWSTSTVIAPRHDQVWWLRAQPDTLAGDYARLASALGLPEREPCDTAVVLAAVRDWLSDPAHDRWLLGRGTG